MIELTTYHDGREGFRHRDLRQALYDAGHRLMDGVIVNLHGDEHVARRRLENRLFRRDTFAWYETESIPTIIEHVLAEPLIAGRGELGHIARRTMMRLSVDVAGVDVSDDDFERFYELMSQLAQASTVAHAVGDDDAIAAIIGRGDEALAAFATEFYAPSLDRRRALVDAGGPLPRDVLTTLLTHRDTLELPDETMLKEIAYYPWVGSHSTSAQLVHAMHHIFVWLDEFPDDRAQLIDDGLLRQRFVHESMRLHPASPVAVRIATADVELKTGVQIADSERVQVNVEAANRDPSVFGPEPDQFDPYRTLPDGIAPWGLSFGSGTHSCLARELAGGLGADEVVDHHLLGATTLMAGRLLGVGARPDPDNPAEADPGTTREMWGPYPVLFNTHSS